MQSIGLLLNCIILVLYVSAPSLPPSAVVVNPVNSTAIFFSWTLPPPRARNGIIRGYKIFYNSTDGNSGSVRVIHGNNTRSLVVSGLRKYTYYAVQLLAFTKWDGPLTSRKVVQTEQDG